MATKSEKVMVALKELLEWKLQAFVKRNIAVPGRIPDEGLVIIRDGDPGEGDVTLGGFRNVYYQHAAEVEIYARAGDDETRDLIFDQIISGIGVALESDRTLGGLAFGMTYGRPDVNTEPVEGAEDIKTGTMILMIDYETTTPLG